MTRSKVKIAGTGKFLPKKILTNSDLEKMVDTSDEWIRTRTGIEQRRITGTNESTSDLAIQAAREALLDAKVTAQEIDLIIVCTCTPDMAFPSVSCLVQASLNANSAACMDISAACSGFIYGLATVRGFIESGTFSKILLIGVDTLSKITNWQDRSTCVLFGDGAGAAVLTKSSDESSILSVYLGANGTHANILKVPGGGSRKPISQEVLDEKSHTIQMDGPEVYKLAVTKMVESSQKALALANIKADELKLIIPHQANLRIMDSVAKRLGIGPDRVFANVQKYGNMSAATTIIALDEAQKENKIKRGDLIELVAFGAGLTWGASVIRW